MAEIFGSNPTFEATGTATEFPVKAWGATGIEGKFGAVPVLSLRVISRITAGVFVLDKRFEKV